MASFFGENSANSNSNYNYYLQPTAVVSNANMLGLLNAYTHSTIPYTSFQNFVYKTEENQIVATPASEENGEPYTKVDENENFGTVLFYAPKQGYYKLTFKYFKQSNQGKARISVKDMATFITTDIDIDLYGETKTMTSFVSNKIYLSSGNNQVTLTNIGKNELSSGYAIAFIGDGISVSAV